MQEYRIMASFGVWFTETKQNPVHQIGTNADPNNDPKTHFVSEEFF